MKKIIFIVGGIILIALLVRLGWAFWQVRNDEAKVAPLATTTTNNEIKSDTFTTAQLANLKNDLTALYLKYQDRTETEKNTEPLRSQVYQEMDAIFLKDLGVVTKISADDIWSASIFLQPEVADIISDIEAQYGNTKNVPVAVVPTSKIVISNLNYSSIPISDLSKYATKALTFNVTNVGLAKEFCTVTYHTYLDDPKNHPLNRPHTLCNPYYSKVNGVYSDPVYFSNLASSYSGGYDGTSKNYFEIEGIDNTIEEFYLKDTSGKESNRLKLTITGAPKKVNAQGTTPSPVSTANVSTSAPTATMTVNGVTNLNVKVGDKVNIAWSSTNANNFLTAYSTTGCSDSTRNKKDENEDTASGSKSPTILAEYLGCTMSVTYTAKNLSTGKQATATAIIKVSSSAPVATTVTPANKCSVITMTNALSTVPARQSIDFPAQGATLIAGQTYTTSWLDEKYNSPDSYPVYLSTTPKNDPLDDLGTAYKAECSFTFTIPSSATPGSNYRLMFSRNGMTSIYSNVFTISK